LRSPCLRPLREVFPIESYDEKLKLDFVTYEVSEPKLTSLQALREGETFSAALYVTFPSPTRPAPRKERVYMGELPLMTEPRHLRHQRRRARRRLPAPPLAGHLLRDLHLNGKLLHGFRIIPDRGTWLEVQFDTNDLLYVYLDRRRRRRKFLATTFLRAIGYPTDEDIIKPVLHHREAQALQDIDEEELATKVPYEDVSTAKSSSPAPTSRSPRHRPPVARARPQEGAGHRHRGRGRPAAQVAPQGSRPDEEEALKDIYRRSAPAIRRPCANARALLKRLFFDPKRYDLTRVGRYKINQKLGLKTTSSSAS
jgi:DNA-directed RNA polymerase subunit beta